MILSASSIYKRFGGREVLRGATFSVSSRENAVLLGPNGAGKSTLLRVLAGVIEPDRGSVTLDGESLLDRNPKARARIGYVPEGADPPQHLTLAELLALTAALKGAPPPPADVLDRLGVRLLLEQQNPIQTFSLGQRRRACIAAALVGDPAVLMLDEPTNGLDPGGIRMLADLLRERRDEGRIALVTTHDLPFADAIAGRRIHLMAGAIAPESATLSP